MSIESWEGETEDPMDWGSWENIKPWEGKWLEALRLATIERCDAMGVNYGGEYSIYPTLNTISVPIIENSAQCLLINYDKLYSIEYFIKKCFAIEYYPFPQSSYMRFMRRGFCVKKTEEDTWGALNVSAMDGMSKHDIFEAFYTDESDSQIPLITYDEAIKNANVWIPDLSRDMLITNDYIKKWFWLQYKIINQLTLLKGYAPWHVVKQKTQSQKTIPDYDYSRHWEYWFLTKLDAINTNIEDMEDDFKNANYSIASFDKDKIDPDVFVGSYYYERVSTPELEGFDIETIMNNSYGFCYVKNLIGVKANVRIYIHKAEYTQYSCFSGEWRPEDPPEPVYTYNENIKNTDGLLASYILSGIVGGKDEFALPPGVISAATSNPDYLWTVGDDVCLSWREGTAQPYGGGETIASWSAIPGHVKYPTPEVYARPSPFFTMDYNIEGGFRFRPPAT